MESESYQNGQSGINRRLFLQATSGTVLAEGLIGSVQAGNHQKVAQSKFVEAGAEYITKEVTPINHIDRLGIYSVDSINRILRLKMSNDRIVRPFRNNRVVIAAQRYQEPPVEIASSKLQRLPTKLNRSLYHTGCIPLTESADLQTARVTTKSGVVNAHLGQQRRKVKIGDEVRLIGETRQVYIIDTADQSVTHSKSATESEENGTASDTRGRQASRTIEVHPELVVRNHGQLDVHTPNNEPRGGA